MVFIFLPGGMKILRNIYLAIPALAHISITYIQWTTCCRGDTFSLISRSQISTGNPLARCGPHPPCEGCTRLAGVLRGQRKIWSRRWGTLPCGRCQEICWHCRSWKLSMFRTAEHGKFSKVAVVESWKVSMIFTRWGWQAMRIRSPMFIS